ncbi:hypothetical protein [Nannocystis pusilla]|uniref:hypothetical protein n=1 Tax=Nannocystis pusilla TaxID=889268 RepID=UPI003B82B8B5
MMRPDGAILGWHTTSGPAWRLRPGAAAVELLSPLDEAPRWSNLSLDGRRLIVQPQAAEAYVRDVDGVAKRSSPARAARPAGGSSTTTATSRSTSPPSRSRCGTSRP